MSFGFCPQLECLNAVTNLLFSQSELRKSFSECPLPVKKILVKSQATLEMEPSNWDNILYIQD